MSLPISRVVNVTLTRDRFVDRAGFGVPLFLTTTLKAGVADATVPTTVYGSHAEVAADWDPTDDFYKAALAAFAQDRARQIKVGYVAEPAGADTAAKTASLQGSLDAIEAYDDGWFFVDVDNSMRDEAYLDGLVDWIESREKLAIITSNDAATRAKNDTTSLAGRNKGETEKTGVFYSDEADSYAGFALAAYMAGYNFDDVDSAYTSKFKGLKLEEDVETSSAVVQAVTGFAPGIGQSVSDGNCANIYVDIGGENMVAEGSTLTPNLFLDEIHAEAWLKARMGEEILNLFLNESRVPMDDRGMAQIASACNVVMQRADRAGLVANFEDENGDLQPSYQILPPDVRTISASQRASRIAPATRVLYANAGAVHYVAINIHATY